jgi:uncharacterized membrane protein YfcA
METSLWLPPLAALVISFFCVMGGVSGAFLLVPFQITVLGFVTPAVSATNQVFNLIAIPGGLWRYWKEGRMVWPLAGIIMCGSLPGVILGYFLRISWLQDIAAFKRFAAVILALTGLQLLRDIRAHRKTPPPKGSLRVLKISTQEIRFAFDSITYHCSPLAVASLALVVGIIGGAYGIGGGALIAPFCIAIFRLPIHAVAGAALAGTLGTSVIALAAYSGLPAPPGLAVRPDWTLGLLLGIGGFIGMFAGSRCQRHISPHRIKWLLAILLLAVAMFYFF